MERLKPSKTKVIERIVTGATVLIWVGVLLMAAGLTMAYLNVRAEKQAVAQAESLSFVVTPSAMPTASLTLTRTPTHTHTPTPTLMPPPATPTPEAGETITSLWPADPETLADLHRQPYTHPPTSTSTSNPTPVSSPSATPRPERTQDLEATPVESPAPALSPTATPSPPPTPGISPPASASPNRIVIPSINLDAPVVPIGWYVDEQDGQRISVWDVPDNAAGWHKTSAYPGNPGNVVLNGHHNIRGEVFRYLIDLEPGARILLYVGDTVYRYSVSEKHILKERGEPATVRYQNAQWIAPTEDERLTLVTCWPYTSNTHRLIVVASPHTPEAALSE